MYVGPQLRDALFFLQRYFFSALPRLLIRSARFRYLRTMKQAAFYHQEVANLAWCINSASLLNASAFPQAEVLQADWCENESAELLYALDAAPDALIRAVQPQTEALRRDNRPKWLGKQFEDYIAFWLSNHPDFQLVARNAVVSNNLRTIGEFDFLYRDLRRERTFHLEVACKFYLSVRNTSAAAGFIGPSGLDRLDLKVEKLNTQLQLATSAEGSTALKTLDFNKPDRQVLVKGYIFHHYTNLFRAVAPRGATRDYCAGWYMFANEAADRFRDEAKWLPLPKSDWLSSVHIQRDTLPVLSSVEMMHYIEAHFSHEAGNRYQALMVAQVELGEGGWIEQHRGCIVHNRWPNRF